MQVIGSSPKPPVLSQGRPQSELVEDGDELPEDAPPSVELAHRVLVEIEKSGGKLSFSAATVKVLWADRELVERYRHTPGTKEP